MSYSRAPDFNDFTARGLPLGPDYSMVNVETNFKWKMTERITLEPKYSLYYYLANSNAELGDYIAHVITLEINLPWS